MYRLQVLAKLTVSNLVIFSLLLVPVRVRANDIVPTDDLVGGASVFVFRGSSKRPQEKAGMARGTRSGFGSARSSRARVASQIASARKRKADAAKARATALARQRARERVARLKQSNALAAKGETQLETGDLNGAITSFRESIKLNPKNAEAMAGLSEALTAKGIETAGESNDEAALVYLDEAVKVDPKNAVAYLKIGEIHDSKARNGEAIASFEKAVTIDPELTAVYLPLGLAHAEQKNYVEAEAYLSKAEAAGLATNEARLARADIFIRQGRNADALVQVDAVIKTEPNNAAAVYQRAVIMDRTGRGADAMAGYKRAIEIDPRLAAAWFDIGVASYNAGDYNGALAAYQKVVDIEPANYAAQANLASTYRQLERYAEANAAYKAAEPGNTKNADHYSEWGFCLGKTSEWDKSVARLLTARELSPTAVDNTNIGWAYYNAALVDKRAGNEPAAKEKFELARQYLGTAVQLDPNFDAAYMNLGSTNNALGDHEAAVTALNKAVELRPNWVIALNQLGLGYRGLNNLTAAITAFKLVSQLDSRNIFGLYNLGEVYHLTGNKKEAKKVHDSLKKIDPAFAAKLDGIISGKVVIDKAKRKIESKIPRIPRIPY